MRIQAAIGTVVLALTSAAYAESVLFIGNSFTFGAGSPVRFYRNATVTDLNGEGIGGVPALFKAFAGEAGLDYEVALETRGGTGLDWHLANKREVLGSRAWDVVVAHGYSLLDADKPRDPAKLIATSAELKSLLQAKNQAVELYLTATWSRADQVYPASGAWAGQPIEGMAADIARAYAQAAAKAKATVVPVGLAWNGAIRAGVADANPYDGIEPGKLNLWTYDHYHASTAGYYLEALVVFGRVTGRDPRSLGTNECAAFELGLSAAETRALQQVAYDELVAAGAALEALPDSRSPSTAPQRCAP